MRLTLAPGKFFHYLSVPFADGTTYDVAQLVNTVVSGAVENKKPLSSLLNYSLPC